MEWRLLAVELTAIGLLEALHQRDQVGLQGVTDLVQLDQVEPTLARLVLTDEALRLAEAVRQVLLTEPRLHPQLAQQRTQPCHLLGPDGRLHLGSPARRPCVSQNRIRSLVQVVMPEHQDHRQHEGALARYEQVAHVPRVVSVEKPSITYAHNGAASLSTQYEDEIILAPFTAAEYFRYLLAWSASNMPVAPPGDQERQRVRPLTWFGLAFILAALVALGANQSSHSTGALAALVIFGILGFACLMEASTAKFRERDPAAWAQSQAIGWQADGYRHLHEGQWWRAASAFDMADRAASRAEAHQAVIAERVRSFQEREATAWHRLATLSEPQRWATAEWLRQSLADEYSRRTNGAAPASHAPIPTYVEAVASLTCYPTRW